MIAKYDIIDRATEWQLRPEVVEKDYIIGWLLNALSQNPESSVKWVFKGGTCLKKCYFETYRFSEDLDFSLKPDAVYDEAGIKAVLMQVAKSAAESSGIEFPAEMILVEPKHNLQQELTFKGRIYYRGPLLRRDYSRILIDITRSEPIIAEASSRHVFHPYPDFWGKSCLVSTYSPEEILAEKMRALFERTRPRDLYDVVFILDNRIQEINIRQAYGIFVEKCKAKKFEAPGLADMLNKIKESGELRTEWGNMLGHQLPELPEIESFLKRCESLLPLFFEPTTPKPRLASYAHNSGEVVIAPAGMNYWSGGQSVEVIRFAAVNRLLVEFDYHGKRRIVEPYSLRKPQTGNLLMYAWELAAGHMKAFKIDEMTNIKSTHSSFAPRFEIEFLPSGPIIPQQSTIISLPKTKRLIKPRRK